MKRKLACLAGNQLYSSAITHGFQVSFVRVTQVSILQSLVTEAASNPSRTQQGLATTLKRNPPPLLVAPPVLFGDLPFLSWATLLSQSKPIPFLLFRVTRLQTGPLLLPAVQVRKESRLSWSSPHFRILALLALLALLLVLLLPAAAVSILVAVQLLPWVSLVQLQRLAAVV
jgi:hypothetical protein